MGGKARTRQAKITKKEIKEMLPKNVEAKETGHATMLDRVKAARRMLDQISSDFTDDERRDVLSPASAEFINEMLILFEDYDSFDLVELNKPTAKQFFWIRDCFNKLMGVE